MERITLREMLRYVDTFFNKKSPLKRSVIEFTVDNHEYHLGWISVSILIKSSFELVNWNKIIRFFQLVELKFPKTIFEFNLKFTRGAIMGEYVLGLQFNAEEVPRLKTAFYPYEAIKPKKSYSIRNVELD